MPLSLYEEETEEVKGFTRNVFLQLALIQDIFKRFEKDLEREQETRQVINDWYTTFKRHAEATGDEVCLGIINQLDNNQTPSLSGGETDPLTLLLQDLGRNNNADRKLEMEMMKLLGPFYKPRTDEQSEADDSGSDDFDKSDPDDSDKADSDDFDKSDSDDSDSDKSDKSAEKDSDSEEEKENEEEVEEKQETQEGNKNLRKGKP